MAWKNRGNLAKRIAAIPIRVRDTIEVALEKEVDALVEADKRACPVGVPEEDEDPGKLRNSIHKYQNPDREMSWRVIADAKDKGGNFIGSPVEQGHRAVDGTHVAGRPFFFPTYRALKKGMRSRLGAVARKAFKEAAGHG